MAIIGALGFAAPAYAGPNVSVEFETTPLFQELNTMPGDSTTRWVKVTNHTAETRVIGVSAVNQYDCSLDPYCLADILTIDIREGATVLYSNSLSGFFADSVNDGGVVLSSLAGGETTTQYDIMVSFPAVIGNDYQTLTVFFDLVFGFVTQPGTNGGGVTISTTGGGGGGGGFFTPLLHIQKSGDAIVEPDGTASYILSVSNLGLAAANAVVVTDTLPAGFTFAPPITGTVTVSAGQETQTWLIPIIGPGAVQTISYSITVPANASGKYTNVAIVSAQGATSGNFYDDDSFDFSAVTVAGYEYNVPVDDGSASHTSGTGANGLVQEFTKVLGFEQLPVTGGDVLAYFGIGKTTNPLSPEKHNTISQYIVVIIGALLIGFLVGSRLFLQRRGR